MSDSTRWTPWTAFALATLVALAMATPARAWIHDRDANHIDDRIELVEAQGYAAAFENFDVSKRLRIEVTDGVPLRYAIYVGFDHHPTPADSAALLSVGLPWVQVYRSIDYVRSEATFAEIAAIAAWTGVTRLQAIPRLYPTNAFGTRVVRARDSRGLMRSENYALFPSVRQDLGLDGSGIVIGILDSGANDAPDGPPPLYPGHESLRGKFLGGGNFFSGNPAGNTPLDGSENPSDHGPPTYHATHVAATALGTGGPGGFSAGVAPGARLVDCKLLSDAGASVAGAADGLQWCIVNRDRLWDGLVGADTAYRGIDVINLSLGSVEPSDGTDVDALMVNAAVAAGIVVVAASGNGFAQNTIGTPAAADSAITVGASIHSRTLGRADDQVSDFSNEGPRGDDGDLEHIDEMKPDLVAPGAAVVSANGDPASDGTTYTILSGTSMSSPAVAGCAALLLQARPDLQPLQVRDILRHTAEHNVAPAPISLTKPTGDRPNDPFGIDPNYDPGCGWGLADIYAACKEAIQGAAGAQVTQFRPTVTFPDPPGPVPPLVDVTWVTQRETVFLGFDVYRAPDVSGVPGAFVKINATPIPPAGDPVIERDDNRTPYVYVDNDILEIGRTYWYRVAWLDLAGAHFEPPAPLIFGAFPRVATATYSISHDSHDNDLTVKVGTSGAYVPALPDFYVFGRAEAHQDSFDVLIPPNPFDPFIPFLGLGNVEHFFSIDFTTADGIESLLPPSQAHPWFLNVFEGGYADRRGRLNRFSLFVNDAPGSPSGTTYVTNTPTPRPMVEGTEATLWIPEPLPTVVAVARFVAAAEPGAIRLTLVLGHEEPGLTAEVLRGPRAELAGSERIAAARPVSGTRFVHLDEDIEPGIQYWYWVRLVGSEGAILSGPVAATVLDAADLTFALPMAPNPVLDRSTIEYRIGRDVAGAGAAEVSLSLHDLQGRRIKRLTSARRAPGIYRAVWDATDDHGARVAPGVYYLRFRAGGVTQSMRVAVIR